jgi:hypothetical protein
MAVAPAFAADPSVAEQQTLERGGGADSGYGRWSNEVRYNKSWIAIDWGAVQRPLVEGDEIGVPVEYFLDPSEHDRSTKLQIEALGPRVPKADAGRPVSFENTQHLWYGDQAVNIEPGRGRHAFALTVPKSSSQNDLLLFALFTDSRAKRWPCDVRAGAWFARQRGSFELETNNPGNLFTYDEPLRVAARLKNVKGACERKVLTYKLYDFTKALVAQGSVPFTVLRDVQTVAVPLRIARRGTFLFQAEVAGWERRETTICFIPDLAAITKGNPTRLGFTVHAAPQVGSRTETMFQVARRLGLTSCRAFTEWKSIEPGPRHYALEHWENESCAFVIQWECPGLERVSETIKCDWVLRQWTDELAAGCEKLIYFGA